MSAVIILLLSVPATIVCPATIRGGLTVSTAFGQSGASFGVVARITDAPTGSEQRIVQSTLPRALVIPPFLFFLLFHSEDFLIALISLP